MLAGDLVQVRSRIGPRDTGPLLITPPQSSRISLPWLGRCVHDGRMRFARVLEAADPLVHVPAERADDADVVVVPHVAVGHDVEARFFLIADHRRDGIVVRFFVLDFLERDANVAAEQLVLEPMRPGIRPDHRGREKSVDDLRCHVILCCLGVSISSRLVDRVPVDAGRKRHTKAAEPPAGDRTRRVRRRLLSRRRGCQGG